MNQIKNRKLKERIIDISYRHKLSHLGSCLSSIDIINDIFSNKVDDEKFILSCGHAGLALYVVLEDKFKIVDAPKGFSLAEGLLLKHGIHPSREVIHLSEPSHEVQNFIDCSTGSLGQGLPIACGMALADRTKNVYCLISDGECAEGSIWEAIRIAWENHLSNLKIYVNINGWGAYRKTDVPNLIDDLMAWKKRGVNIEICETNIRPFDDLVDGLKGQSAHYYTLTEEDHKVLMEVLE